MIIQAFDHYRHANIIAFQLQVKYFEEGLENVVKAFLKLMRGYIIGKQLVHVADP